MQTLRNMNHVARFVLAGFLLALGVGVASPWFKPRTMELVCSGGYLKLVTQDGVADSQPGSVFDCPLCGTADSPPPVRSALFDALRVAGPTPSRSQASHAPGYQAGTPPARGPPRWMLSA